MKTFSLDISIIIPCYNTTPGFIQEAIDSVSNSNGKHSYHIIIVDDGSANGSTVQFLKQLKDEDISVIFQSNKGPAAARNTGVKNANSKYILFLDSDDRLKPEFIDEGITALEANIKAGVVYTQATAIGDASRKNFIALPFDITDLLINNFIPMCALIKKQAWEDAGGIDENLVQYEDWEFWINVFKAGWEFIFIDKPMFEYRIQSTSLIAQSGVENFKTVAEYIYKKHADLVYTYYHQLYVTRTIYRNDIKRPFRSLFKYIKQHIST